ncbi:MAG TPA: restriction endonuclease subunit S [Geobacteraceae bacterium]
MRYPAYPTYKDSGDEWIKRIPSHWQIKKLKFLSSIQNSNVDKKTEDGELPVRLCNYVDVYKNDFINSEIDFMVATATAEEMRRFKLRKDDVIITKDSESWDDIAVPACVEEDFDDVLCGYHLAQIRPKKSELLGRYLFRCFSALGICNQFKVAANGVTRFGLPKDAIVSSVFPVPTFEEQECIAAFLDRKTARIDTLIAKKQRIIELLQEKRTVLISRAVTKGLDAGVQMKDSGVEWLGEIPAHWEVKRLKYAVTLQRGHDLPSDNREDGCVPIVSSAGVSGSHNKAAAKAPGIVTGRYGTIGKFHIIEEDYWPLNTTLYSNNCHGNNVRYLWYMLQNIAEVFLVNSTKSAVPGVDRNDLHPTLIALPPTATEQDAISSFLDGATAKLDGLSHKVNEAIESLREYRSSLICGAVTGKIDVRQEV